MPPNCGPSAALPGIFGLDVPRDFKDVLVVGFVAGLILITAVFFLIGWVVMRRELAKDEAGRDEPEPAASGELATAIASGPCSACGGPVPFRVGEATARCPHCAATVLPPEAARARLTTLATYSADLATARRSRDMVRGDVSGPVGRGLEAVMWLVRRMMLFVPLIVGISVGQTLTEAPAPRRHGRRGRAGVHLSHPGSEPRFCEPAAAAWMLDRAVGLAAGSGA